MEMSTPSSSSSSPDYLPDISQGKFPSHSKEENGNAVCVVGMACRLPGDVRSPVEMWKFLVNTKSAQGRVPTQRFNVNGFYHRDDNRAGTMSADGGYFLSEDVRQFDNSFFGINNLEATYMDPHQRKLLEVAYECFESAGLSMDDISGTKTGVYVSNFTVDYTNMHFRDPDYLHRYSSTGSNMAIIANRISHVFNLQGPSLSLNTACSSSLYCLHTAVRAIEAGDCENAIVAGANLIMSPEQHLETMKGGVLSRTSSCHTFDESADGYGRAEGVNAVYLKRLSSALKDGDKIWGVIRGTAVNSNGKTPGIAQPSADLQEEVIRKAYSNAKLSFADTDYIECHGTGTSRGDVIEVEALGRCFAPREGYPLLVGSVKTNFGHSEAASGLTSLIKVLLAFEHAKIPPSYGVRKLNPKLHLDSLNMKVATKMEEWPRATRRASISSFGYGGSNSHVILESPESYLGVNPHEGKPIASITNQILVLPVSAKSSKSLELRMQQISSMIQNTSVPLMDLAFTLTQRMSHLRKRQCLLVRNSKRTDIDSMQLIDAGSADPRPVAFVFTGQGAQYEGIFLQTIRELDIILKSLPLHLSPAWSLEQAIISFQGIAISQATEIATAYAAGLLTAPQSIIVVFLRGYTISQLGEISLMILITKKKLAEMVCVAYVNDPENLILKLIIPYLDTNQDEEEIGLVKARCNMVKYWCKNLEKLVQFSAAVGPHYSLRGPIKRIMSKLPGKRSQPYSPTLTRGQSDDVSIKRLAGTLFTHGHSLRWREVNAYPNGTLLFHNIPPYPWEYPAKLLWHEPRASLELRNRRYLRHELLGSRQLAGNDVDWNWRNIIRLNEVPWIRDHKLENQVVFPAAAYLTMAIEAMSQVHSLQHKLNGGIGFEFRNVSFIAAFALQDEVEVESTELHTTLTARQLSTTRSSTEWYDFSISSWTDGQATMHCAGSIRLTQTSALKETVAISDVENYELWASMDRWYERLRDGGLNFGPHFNSVTSLRTDGSRSREDAISTTSLQPQIESSTPYVLHPIVIDACIQAAIFGGTGGTLSSLHAHLPIFISECRINTSGIFGAEASIHTRSTKTGISTKRIDCTLWNSRGVPVLDMKNVRMSLYTGKTTQGPQSTSGTTNPQRHPCLRVRWKPDIMRLDQDSESQLKDYMDDFIMSQHPDFADDLTLSTIGSLLDLAGHKTPSMRVLELGNGCRCKTEEWSSLLGKNTPFPRFRSWDKGSLREDGNIEIEGGAEGTFDVLLIPGHTTSKQGWKDASDQLLRRVRSDRGIVISRRTQEAVATLLGAQFTLVDAGHKIILATRQTDRGLLRGREVVIVYRNYSADIEEVAGTLTTYLHHAADVGQVRQVILSELDSLPIYKDTICISLLELEQEFLASMGPKDMNLLRIITNTVTDLAWVTGTQALDHSNPSLTMSSGLSRSLMLEQPSLRFSIVDVGPLQVFKQNTQTACRNIVKALIPQYELDDKEFVQTNGVLFVSRFYPDVDLNSLFHRRLSTQVGDQIRKTTLTSAEPARLNIGKVGDMDTIHFQQLREPATELPAGFIDIQVKAVSLNAKDVYNFSGRMETREATTACELAGIVVAVAHDVANVQPGDRVVVMAPNYFTTTERVPAWTAHKLLPSETFTEMSTILIAYSTALFALHDCAQLRKGQSVLIHGGSGALGLAAINIAQNTGAVVYTTVSSQAKKDFLISQFGIPESHIFSSRDTSFLDGINNATAGCGVDVVLNSLIGDLMHASWSCIASFGRFIEVGKRELMDAGKLDMAVFQRNATFSAFDLSEMFFSKDRFVHQAYTSKMKEALEWYRSGHVKLGPFKVFDVADISQAYRYFSRQDRVGKVVISLENPKSQIQVIEPRYRTIFNPNKAYLLVGCLGGLGRSISRWMATRGARHLVFLGRSGLDKPSAQKLIKLLQSMGVESKVIKGDVLSSEDVTRAVKACVANGNSIGGVIQAAMGLHEALFSRMSNAAWHEGIDAKLMGTWNLHTALEGHDEALDFFLMTSSVSGTVGIATEANYCASNGFLDAFARWRRQHGKPATSIGLGMISEVGYLHENPDVQNILLRKGIYPLNEDELLQVIDFALAAGVDTDPENAHILTGMESLGFRDLMAKGFDVNNLPMLDPRSSILAEALESEHVIQDANIDAKQGRFAANTAVWANELPALISGSLSAEADAASLQEAILRAIRKQCSNLTLTPLAQIENEKPLAQFGVDSMIASEFRTWFWASFKVDIPFLDLLSATRSLSSLAKTVEMKLREG
ncbi:polyketide synthase-like protein [Hypoxylon sp. FL0890]|nr:polyketide synthase-like protein [Hypoxylon sp. FL0890]